MRTILFITLFVCSHLFTYGQQTIEKRFEVALTPYLNGQVDSTYLNLYDAYKTFDSERNSLIDRVEKFVFNEESKYIDVRFGARLLLEIGSDRSIEMLLDAIDLKKPWRGPTNASQALAALNGHDAKNPVIDAINMGGDRAKYLVKAYVSNSKYLDDNRLSEKQVYNLVKLYRSDSDFYRMVDDHYGGESQRGQNLHQMKKLIDK